MAEPMTAGDLCTRNVVFVTRRTALDETAKLMREYHVGTIVVVDERAEGRVVVGMLTDRDIVTSIVAKGLDPATVRAEDAMSTDLVTTREEESLLDVLAIMRGKGVRRIPVVDMRGALVGLVSLDDVLEVIAEQLQMVVKVMETGREREPVKRP